MGHEVFDRADGPYIPAAHREYGLLPRRRADGGEVFACPVELDAIEDWVADLEGSVAPDGTRRHHIVPYGFGSYAEYFALLAHYADRYRQVEPELASALDWLSTAVKRMNVKEEWSVVRYIGNDREEYRLWGGYGLTAGHCYYWPCSRENPAYEGVIDDAECSLCLYPCDPDIWEVMEDPTGMASRVLYSKRTLFG